MVTAVVAVGGGKWQSKSVEITAGGGGGERNRDGIKVERDRVDGMG